MKKRIFLSKQIHSCFSSASSGDVWVNKEVGSLTKEKLACGKLFNFEVTKLPHFIIVYVEADETFYQRGLREGALMVRYSDTPEFKELVNKYLADGWSLELPPEVYAEQQEMWKKAEDEYEAKRKRRGCVLLRKENRLPAEFQGGLSDSVFQVGYLQQYIKNIAVFGYVGHSGRTYQTDKCLEKEFMKVKSSVEVDKAHLLAIWLTSTDGRHFGDTLEGLPFYRQRVLIEDKIKNIFLNAFIYSLPGHKGTYESTVYLAELWRDSLFTEEKRHEKLQG